MKVTVGDSVCNLRHYNKEQIIDATKIENPNSG